MMLRSGYVNSIFAYSYSQSPSSPDENIIYNLFKNDSMTPVASLTITDSNVSAFQTGLNIPFNFGDYFTVSVKNGMSMSLTATSFYISIQYT
jgi:hypothetical protein